MHTEKRAIHGCLPINRSQIHFSFLIIGLPQAHNRVFSILSITATPYYSKLLLKLKKSGEKESKLSMLIPCKDMVSVFYFP